MLPDFPRLKEELHRMLVLGVRVERPEASPLLAGFASHHMHEGDRAVLVRENGEEQEIPLHDYTAEEMVDLTEVQLPTLAESYKRYLDAVSRIEKEVAADIEDLVDRAAESVGNVVDLGGDPCQRAFWRVSRICSCWATLGMWISYSTFSRCNTC